MPVSFPRPLQVLPLGIGGAFSRFNYYCSLIVMGGRTICLIDCPDPIHKMLHEATAHAGMEIGPEDLNHIVLTHLHGDHSNGLESFLFYRKFVARLKPPTIHALPEVVDALWDRKLAISMANSDCPEIGVCEEYGPDDYYNSRAVDDGRFTVGDLSFEIRRSAHLLPTFGLRVSYGDRCFGYSCDTAFNHGEIDFLAPSDLIFHECGSGPVHTPYEKLIALSPDVRGKIHILHLEDHFDRSRSELPIVEPGRVYTV